MRYVLIFLGMALATGAEAQNFRAAPEPATEPDQLEWWNDDEGRSVTFGVRDSSMFALQAKCFGSGVDLTLLFPDEPLAQLRHGQPATAYIWSYGRTVGQINGVLHESQADSEWMLEAKVSGEHPLFDRLFSGSPIYIVSGQGRYLIMTANGGSKALATFRRTCKIGS